MSSAPLTSSRRRALLMVALVVLLHWMALGLLLDVKPGLPLLAATHDERLTMTAQLLPSAEQPLPPAPEPLQVPDAPPPPVPELAPLPVEVATPAEPAGITESAAPALAEATPAGEGAGPGPVAAEPPPPAQAAAEPPPEPATPPVQPSPEPPAPELRRYVVDMPPSATIKLDVARTDADGTEWSGEAQLAWQLKQDTYHVKVEAGIRVVFARVNLVVLESEGAIADAGFAPIRMTEKRRGRSLTALFRHADAGFAPIRMTEKRRGRSLTATHFDWGTRRVTFSASEAAYGLRAGAQDKATIPLQLAAIARGDPKQLSGAIDIFVGEDRDAAIFRFKVVGQEAIDTPLGRLQAWHLSRPPQPGSYKSQLDIWLAPEHGWYPVRIRNTEASGAVTTQTVNNIVLNHSGS